VYYVAGLSDVATSRGLSGLLLRIRVLFFSKILYMIIHSRLISMVDVVLL